MEIELSKNDIIFLKCIDYIGASREARVTISIEENKARTANVLKLKIYYGRVKSGGAKKVEYYEITNDRCKKTFSREFEQKDAPKPQPVKSSGKDGGDKK